MDEDIDDTVPDRFINGIKAIVQNPDQFYICSIIQRKKKVNHKYFKKYVLFSNNTKFTYFINQLIKHKVIVERDDSYSFTHQFYAKVIEFIKANLKKEK
jgi:hypothetical protein